MLMSLANWDHLLCLFALSLVSIFFSSFSFLLLLIVSSPGVFSSTSTRSGRNKLNMA